MESRGDLEPVVYTPVSAAANLRRSLILGVALGVVAIVISSLESHPLFGVFGLLGIVLGAANNRALQKSVIHYAMDSEMTKQRFRHGVVARLLGITVLAIALAFIDHPDGYGVFAGLAVFQVLMLIGAAVPVFRGLKPRPQS